MTRRVVVPSTETEDLEEGKRVWGNDDESRRFLESENCGLAMLMLEQLT